MIDETEDLLKTAGNYIIELSYEGNKLGFWNERTGFVEEINQSTVYPFKENAEKASLSKITKPFDVLVKLKV